MESQMVQNSRSKIVFTFNKFFYHGQERFQSSSPKSIQVTFKGFSFKVTAYFNQAQKQKLTHSTNFNLTSREYCVKFQEMSFPFFQRKVFLSVTRSLKFILSLFYFSIISIIKLYSLS